MSKSSHRIQRKTSALESLFHKVVPTQVFSCKYCKIFKNNFFEELLRTAGFWWWSSKAAMKSNVCLLNWMKWGKIQYCFIFIRFILALLYLYSISSCTEVFLKVVLKNFPKSTRKILTFTGVSFLSATSNFIIEETPAQCFPKPLLTIFAESSILKFLLDFKYASVLPLC